MIIDDPVVQGTYQVWFIRCHNVAGLDRFVKFLFNLRQALLEGITFKQPVSVLL